MEGCSKYCTFLRSSLHSWKISRSLDEILFEVSALVKNGVREVTLLGRNVNAYKEGEN